MRDLTFSKLKKKKRGGGAGTQGCRQTFEKAGGGGGCSIVGFEKNGGGGGVSTYCPGHMPGAQHIHLNLFFFFKLDYSNCKSKRPWSKN